MNGSEAAEILAQMSNAPSQELAGEAIGPERDFWQLETALTHWLSWPAKTREAILGAMSKADFDRINHRLSLAAGWSWATEEDFAEGIGR